MKLKTILLTITAVCFASGLLFAADLSVADKTYLANYEKVHAALVADDLAAAKSAAKEIANPYYGQKMSTCGEMKN